jgi:hypothetical protein
MVCKKAACTKPPAWASIGGLAAVPSTGGSAFFVSRHFFLDKDHQPQYNENISTNFTPLWEFFRKGAFKWVLSIARFHQKP